MLNTETVTIAGNVVIINQLINRSGSNWDPAGPNKNSEIMKSCKNKCNRIYPKIRMITDFLV